MRKLLLALPVLAAGMMLHSGILRGYDDELIKRDVDEARLLLVKATDGDRTRGGFDKGDYINKDNVKNLDDGNRIFDEGVVGDHGLTRI